jgi:hypothetical protein
MPRLPYAIPGPLLRNMGELRTLRCGCSAAKSREGRTSELVTEGCVQSAKLLLQGIKTHCNLVHFNLGPQRLGDAHMLVLTPHTSPMQ